mmetsp:Transcript_11839/g.21489  ORF Transcript_11839/g.21489 Transcript_11839/m.21489 type:complete len:332 (+) Transcript_11839:827-1822(+)
MPVPLRGRLGHMGHGGEGTEAGVRRDDTAKAHNLGAGPAGGVCPATPPHDAPLHPAPWSLVVGHVPEAWSGYGPRAIETRHTGDFLRLRGRPMDVVMDLGGDISELLHDVAVRDARRGLRSVCGAVGGGAVRGCFPPSALQPLQPAGFFLFPLQLLIDPFVLKLVADQFTHQLWLNRIRRAPAMVAVQVYRTLVLQPQPVPRFGHNPSFMFGTPFGNLTRPNLPIVGCHLIQFDEIASMVNLRLWHSWLGPIEHDGGCGLTILLCWCPISVVLESRVIAMGQSTWPGLTYVQNSVAVDNRVVPGAGSSDHQSAILIDGHLLQELGSATLAG